MGKNIIQKVFPISSNLNFYVFAKFLLSFLKTVAKFFRFTKFHQKPSIFLRSFFKISSQLIVIRKYAVMSAGAFQENWKFFLKFH